MCDPLKLPISKSTSDTSVSEISQLFQPKIMIKVRSDLQQKKKPNYAWIANITTSCKELSSDPSMKGLNSTVKCFLKHLQEVIKVTLKNVKRSQKLRLQVQIFLTYFHTIYLKIKRPFDHTIYKDKMAEIMAMYIDLELKSSMSRRNDPKSLISERICSSLFICLDKSMEHILDAIFKTSKFSLKSYNEICSAVMKRVLHDSPASDYDINYVRYLLAYKLWLKIAGKEHSTTIVKQAIVKLRPPADFHDKLKNGKLTNLLPFLPKPDRNRATTFYMQSQFDLKDKIQAFLKHVKNKEAGEDTDNSVVILDDLEDITTQATDAVIEEDILEKIWHQCNDNDLCDDTSYIINEMDTLINGDDEEFEQKKDSLNENCNIPSIEIENRFRSLAKKNFNSPEKRHQIPNYTNIDIVIENRSLASDLSKEDNGFALNDKSNDVIRIGENISASIIHGTEPILHQKPCATIGPGQIESLHAVQSTQNYAELPDSSVICEQSNEVLISNEMFDVVDEVEIRSGNFVLSSPSSLMVHTDENMDNSEAMDEIEEIPIGNDLSCNTHSVFTPEKGQKYISSNPNNHQFNLMSPYVASADTPVSFGRRQDSYSHNESILHDFIYSEPFTGNADDNSDEDNRCHAFKQYSHGGKQLPAFREQNEYKCDSGEEFVSSSPSSDRTVVEESYINNIDSATSVGHFIENDVKTSTLSSVKGENSFTLCKIKQVDDSHNGRVILNTNLGNKQSNFISSGSTLDNFSNRVFHDKQVTKDLQFSNYQQHLYDFYTNTANLIATEPPPFPPSRERCLCGNCENNYLTLLKNNKHLCDMRRTKIVHVLDTHRSLAKRSHEANLRSIENVQLLKEIEESFEHDNNSSNNDRSAAEENYLPVSKSLEPMTVGDKELHENNSSQEESGIHQSEAFTSKEIFSMEGSSSTFTTTSLGSLENKGENKSDYQSLPPKKRKAFSSQLANTNRQSDLQTPQVQVSESYLDSEDSRQGHDISNEVIQKDGDIAPFSGGTKKIKRSGNKGNHNEIVQFGETITKECSVVVDRLDKYLPVKIKSVDGTYCVLSKDRPSTSETCDNMELTDNNDHSKCSKKDKKCHRKKKKSKEERKLRKEKRRMKRIMKENNIKL